MNEYWVIALSLGNPISHRQYAARIEAENDEMALEKAGEWFSENHPHGHQGSKYKYFLTKKVSK